MKKLTVFFIYTLIYLKGFVSGNFVKMDVDEWEKSVPEVSITAVLGSAADMPCDLSTNNPDDEVRLVLWFKNNSSLPIYTYDTRVNSLERARHWYDNGALGGRALFTADSNGGHFYLDNVKLSDEGTYTYRVDFLKAPTRIASINLKIIVPSLKPRIFVEHDKEVGDILGPYRIGDTVRLVCEAVGGRPSPRVTWWLDHSLLDENYRRIGSTKVENQLTLPNLRREDLHTILTCQSSNNNISVPISTSVKLDMHFGPTVVRLLNGKDPLSAGQRYEIVCQTIGARPYPTITWWISGKQITSGISIKTSHDGNITVATLTYRPSMRDAGSRLICRAGVAGLKGSTLEDVWKLEVHYSPSSKLSLGSNLNASFIKVGDDVYFECAVRANPKPYKITWRHNGRELSHNVQKKIIISNQSLVLQKVTRSDSGTYTCTSHNSEGDGESNRITLNIRYKPFCKPGQVRVYGVAKHEKIGVKCSVTANPSNDLLFEWVFNTSSEQFNVQESLIETTGSRSIVHHTPQSEMDYGSMLCWATNAIGRQDDPCIFHLIPAGKPDPVVNCTVRNQTYAALHISCTNGFDGGLPQAFTMEVKDAKSSFLVANSTSPNASFTITGLHSGTGYIINVYSHNPKGRSEINTFQAFTIKEAQKRVTKTSQQFEKFGPPILGIIFVCLIALIMIILGVGLYICCRRKKVSKYGTTSIGSSRLAFATTTDNQNSLQKEANMDASDTTVILTKERNPDIIPIVKRQDTCDDDGGFKGYKENARYSSLQRHRHKIDNIMDRTLPRRTSQNKGTNYVDSSLLPNTEPAEPIVYARINHFNKTSQCGISPLSLMNTSSESAESPSQRLGLYSPALEHVSSADEGFHSLQMPLMNRHPLVSTVSTVALSSNSASSRSSGVSSTSAVLSPLDFDISPFIPSSSFKYNLDSTKESAV